MMAVQHFQIDSVGVIAAVLLQIVLRIRYLLFPRIIMTQIVRIIGIHMVGRKLTGKKFICGGNMLHIHLCTFHKQLVDLLRIVHGVRCRPVRKCHQALFLIFFALIHNDLVTGLCQHGFKGCGIFGRIHILPPVGTVLPAHMVRIRNRHILPLYTHDISQHPPGDILCIGTAGVGCAVSQVHFLPAVDDIYQSPAVLLKSF